MFDHYGARTSHRADQASKPVTVELLPHLGQNEPETFKNTFSQRALDKFGFIEAWAKFPRPFGPKPAPCPTGSQAIILSALRASS